MKRWIVELKHRLFPDAMIVEGNDVTGYLARYPDEQDAVWAQSREAAIDGCDLRRLYASFRPAKRR